MSRSFDIPLLARFSVIFISFVASDMKPEGGLTGKKISPLCFHFMHFAKKKLFDVICLKDIS
jgi:hypothetical protein